MVKVFQAIIKTMTQNDTTLWQQDSTSCFILSHCKYSNRLNMYNTLILLFSGKVKYHCWKSYVSAIFALLPLTSIELHWKHPLQSGSVYGLQLSNKTQHKLYKRACGSTAKERKYHVHEVSSTIHVFKMWGLTMDETTSLVSLKKQRNDSYDWCYSMFSSINLCCCSFYLMLPTCVQLWIFKLFCFVWCSKQYPVLQKLRWT